MNAGGHGPAAAPAAESSPGGCSTNSRGFDIEAALRMAIRILGADIAQPGLIAALRRQALAYPAETRFSGEAERDRHLSPAQHLAWAVRFGEREAVESCARAVLNDTLETAAEPASAAGFANSQPFRSLCGSPCGSPTTHPTGAQ